MNSSIPHLNVHTQQPINTMPLFGGLANETLFQIIKEISPDDIIALASCCRHLYVLSQELLAYHQEKRVNADDVVVGWYMWTPSAIHPSKHLQDILANDDSRFYTRVLKIGALSCRDPEDDWVNGAEGPHMQAKSALLADIRSQYGCELSSLIAKVYRALLPHAAKTKIGQWINSVKQGEPEAVVILLLALYPDLETLYIRDPSLEWWKDTEWGNLFRSLTTTAMDPTTNTLKIFSRLSDFHLMGSADEVAADANVRMVTPFMALPTMCSILCRVVYGRTAHWRCVRATSEVTNFDLEGDVDPTSLSAYIRGFKALEHFRYQFSASLFWRKIFGRVEAANWSKWGPRADNDTAVEDTVDPAEDDSEPGNVNQPDSKWEPGAITAILLRYAGNSLVSLDLAATGFRGVLDFDYDEPFIGSLRSFQVLKRVCLDTMMFFKRVKCSSNVSLVGRESAHQKSWVEIRAQRLVDFLPPTIESVTMTCVYVGQGLSKGDVTELFTGLPELRHQLPNLLEISVRQEKDRQSDEEKEGLQELFLKCEANEIGLCVNEDGADGI